MQTEALCAAVMWGLLSVLQLFHMVSTFFYPERRTSGTNLLDGDYQQRLVLRLLLRLTVEAEEILPPEDAVDILPAIKVLPQLNGGRRTLMDRVVDDLGVKKKRKKRRRASRSTWTLNCPLMIGWIMQRG